MSSDKEPVLTTEDNMTNNERIRDAEIGLPAADAWKRGKLHVILVFKPLKSHAHLHIHCQCVITLKVSAYAWNCLV